MCEISNVSNVTVCIITLCVNWTFLFFKLASLKTENVTRENKKKKQLKENIFHTFFIYCT